MQGHADILQLAKFVSHSDYHDLRNTYPDTVL